MIVTSFQELKFFIQNITISLVTTAMYKIRFKDIVYLKRNKSRPSYNTLAQVEKEPLKNLLKRDDIIIKPADKGGAVVVWSRPLHIQEALRHLSDGRF